MRIAVCFREDTYELYCREMYGKVIMVSVSWEISKKL